VGNRGFSGAANAARGHAPRGVQTLILMGDWCASGATKVREPSVQVIAGGLEDGALQGKNAWTGRSNAFVPIDGDG
jgi:hypothetical protein